MTGTATGAAIVTFSPSTITFTNTAVGVTSAATTVTLANNGNASIVLGSATVTGDFSIVANSCGASLGVGARCTLTLRFTPAASGIRTGTLSLADASNNHTVTLTGTGVAAFQIVLTPAAVNFGSQIVGTATAITNITISNTGSSTGALGSISVSGDFVLRANTCGASLAAQTGCTVSIVFMPSAVGTRTGLLTVMNAAGTQTATLTGTGTAAATDTLSPLSLTFGRQQADTSSAAQVVTLTNSGDASLTLVSTVIVAGDFGVVNGCGPTVPAHRSCGIAVIFSPKSVGTFSGTLQITDVQRVQTITLIGTGFAGPGVSLLPSTIAFAATGVGVAGTGERLTLTNNGEVPIALTGITLTGDFGIVAGSSTCAITATVPVGGSCSMSVAFLPTASGARSGTVTVSSNAQTQVAQLGGTGVDFALASAGATIQTISNGGSAAYPLLLRPAVSTADPVTYACSGAPAYAKCTVIAQYSDLSAISTVTVTVLTGTATTSLRAAAFILPVLLCLPWYVRRRTVPGHTAFAAISLAVLAGVQGCGSNRAVPIAGNGSGTGAGTTVTPSGSYSLTVSATAAGVTHTVPLTLIVK
nr:choice-of-anchor D domain-containing protein [Terriglobus roseus]